ncbi:MAG: adenosine monophosphate-protein transferase [Archaeoglobi archaeon]|nr:adenosine monophosphate-protein transferase [Archaeoglobi archaeon]
MKLEVVKIENPENRYQVIVGQANFTIFTCDDIFKTLLTTVPGIRCAVAMNEAAPKLTRVTGNDENLKELAAKNALSIAASHVFVVMVENAFPINVLNAIKSHPAVCSIYVASANPIEIIVAETGLGRAVLGAVDGQKVERIETEEEKRERRELVEKLGYRIE